MAARPLAVLSRCFSITARAAVAAPVRKAPLAGTTSLTRVASLGSGRGLEDFFEPGKTWSWNEKETPTGRAWLAAELRLKSFDDLHQLWWICIKEQNKLYSQKEEARRFQVHFPHRERLRELKLTMKRLKLVLWERRIEWFRAQAVLKRAETATALMAEGLSSEEVEAKLAEMFPVPVKDIGRKPSKVKDEQANAAKREETQGRITRRKSRSTWFIV